MPNAYIENADKWKALANVFAPFSFSALLCVLYVSAVISRFLFCSAGSPLSFFWIVG